MYILMEVPHADLLGEYEDVEEALRALNEARQESGPDVELAVYRLDADGFPLGERVEHASTAAYSRR